MLTNIGDHNYKLKEKGPSIDKMYNHLMTYLQVLLSPFK